jgi:hypothetical protein
LTLVILGREDKVQSLREVGRADRRADGGDVFVRLVDRGQALAIAGLEGDEFGGLPGDHGTGVTHRGGEQTGEIAPADDHVGDLLAGLHLGESQGLGRLAGFVARPVGGEAIRAGQHLRIGRGVLRRLGEARHAQQNGDRCGRQKGTVERETHRILHRARTARSELTPAPPGRQCRIGNMSPNSSGARITV